MLLKDTELTTRQKNIFLKKKIVTTDDLLRVVPRAYRDYRKPGTYENADANGYCAVVGLMMSCVKKKAANGKEYIRIILSLEGGEKMSIMSFANLYLYEDYCTYVYSRVVVCGKIDFSPAFGYSMTVVESIELSANFTPYIKSVYRSFKGISDKVLRMIVNQFLEKAEEPLPVPVMDYLDKTHPVYRYPSALSILHNPQSISSIQGASERLVLNDLLYLARCLYGTSTRKESEFRFTERKILSKLVYSLPFALTNDQKTAIVGLCKESFSGKRINALIQGDVGSGKTVVAIALMVNAFENGYQSVLMAPREVLALQHYREVLKHAETVGAKVVFLRSGMKAKERKEALKQIRSGEANIIVGTHACFSEDVAYHSLALVVTDEEHLFGVQQKQALLERADEGVHSISMSATPIPRTMASVLYGEDKEIIEIREKPAGRLPVKTAVISDRDLAIRHMLSEIKKGHQCFVVCPAIEENEDFDITSIEEVEKEYREKLSVYGIKVDVLNGKMSKKEIADTVERFLNRESHVLISTTVIEVGVDIPNATVILIEQAERFGLASLHQLRGRVGRSNLQSYCILLSKDVNNERLQVLYNTTDGFEIAEADLKIRGSGNMIGEEQSGYNRYVEEMLQYPELFKLARKVVSEFEHTNCLDALSEMYEEHNAFL